MEERPQPNFVFVFRFVYLAIVALSVLMIYYVPVNQSYSTPKGMPDIFYIGLIVISIVDLFMMKVLDSIFTRPVPEDASEEVRLQASIRLRNMPVIIASLGMAIPIYGIVYHFIGGSTGKSLSFSAIAVVGYILFSLLAPKYESTRE